MTCQLTLIILSGWILFPYLLPVLVLLQHLETRDQLFEQLGWQGQKFGIFDVVDRARKILISD